MRRGLLAMLLVAGCGQPRVVVDGGAPSRVDAVIVPGCPTEADGRLSGCLEHRALWAVRLWELGVTDAFITSGAATHNRYVEAEALAAAMTAAGVPAERIWLEEQARHTDENVFFAWMIASYFGWEELAVASHGGHASGACSFLDSWGQRCLVAAIDGEVVEAMAREPRYAAALAARVAPLPEQGWLPVGEWEEVREASGGPSRPSSLWLYAWAPLWRLFGRTWVPAIPPPAPPLRYSERLAAASVW